LFRKTFFNHRGAEVIGNANGSRTSADENYLLLLNIFSRNLGSTGDAPQNYRGGSLDVIVKGQKLVLVPYQQRTSIRRGKILPLKTGLRELPFYRLHEAGEKIKILRP